MYLVPGLKVGSPGPWLQAGDSWVLCVGGGFRWGVRGREG